MCVCVCEHKRHAGALLEGAHHDIQKEEDQSARSNGDTHGSPNNGLDRGDTAFRLHCNRAHCPDILAQICRVFKQASRGGGTGGVCVGAPTASPAFRQARLAVAAALASRHPARALSLELLRLPLS